MCRHTSTTSHFTTSHFYYVALLLRRIYAHTKRLNAVPDVGDNGVHASASPFEALVERANWIGADVAADPFGALLLGAGIPASEIASWSTDPQVLVGGEKSSLYDSVEDLDADACVARLTLISLENDVLDTKAEIDAAGDELDLASMLPPKFSFTEFLTEAPLLKADGNTVPVTTLDDADIVALLFSTNLYPPCQGFTEKLISTYSFLKEAGRSFEVVFVSLNKTAEQSQADFSEMPWLAVGFEPEHHAIREQLMQVYEVRSLPTVILLDNEGCMISDVGEDIISSYGPTAYPFDDEALKQAEQMKSEQKNAMMMMLQNNLQLFSVDGADGADSSAVFTADGKAAIPLGDIAACDYVALALGNAADEGWTDFIAPALAKVYADVRDELGDSAFNVVYVPWATVSSDGDGDGGGAAAAKGEEGRIDGVLDEAKEAALRATLPFPCLSLEAMTPAVRAKLNFLLDNPMSPCVAIVTGDGTELVEENASRLIHTFGAKAYPFSESRFQELLAEEGQRVAAIEEDMEDFVAFSSESAGGKLIKSDGSEVSAETLKSNEVVGLYFSAHWCGPCKQFTPTLAKAYTQLKAAGKKFEIIFM